MSKFKVGDKVKRLDGNFNNMVVGDTGIITNISRFTNNLKIKEFPGYGHHNFTKFELVTEKQQTVPSTPRTGFKAGDVIQHVINRTRYTISYIDNNGYKVENDKSVHSLINLLSFTKVGEAGIFSPAKPGKTCNHPNKKVVHLIVSKYLYCPDCKEDLGSA